MTEVLATPIKSPNDKNNYRMIVLSNGMKVLLIQHPKEDTSESSRKLSALSMQIDVGAYDDPLEVKGLSHLLEHMAFMGSKKYPKENEYSQYMNAHGGYANALTGFLETIYFFNINEQYLEGAIDRFSSIFIAPLILEDAIDREMQAVESEYQNKKNSDFIRLHQMIYSLVKEDNPANVFVPGNLSTFRANDRTNSQLYEMLHDHFNKFYVANRMSLVIQSSMELDDLQTIVEKYFSDIKSGEPRPEITEDFYKTIFDKDMFEKLVYVKPKTEVKNITLIMPLPSVSKHYKMRPLDYLSQLIEDEYKGGLCSYLKNKLLITSLSAAYIGTFGRNPLISLFATSFELTEYGSTHIEEILSAFYSFLLLMKDTAVEKHKEIYESWKSLTETKFTFAEPLNVEENVIGISVKVRYVDPIDILRAKKVFIEYDEDILKKYIDLLNEFNSTLR